MCTIADSCLVTLYQEHLMQIKHYQSRLTVDSRLLHTSRDSIMIQTVNINKKVPVIHYKKRNGTLGLGIILVNLSLFDIPISKLVYYLINFRQICCLSRNKYFMCSMLEPDTGALLQSVVAIKQHVFMLTISFTQLHCLKVEYYFILLLFDLQLSSKNPSRPRNAKALEITVNQRTSKDD